MTIYTANLFSFIFIKIRRITAFGKGNSSLLEKKKRSDQRPDI